MVVKIRQLLRRNGPDEEPVSEEPKEMCLSCGSVLETNRLYQRFRVCQDCGFHFHVTARERIALLLDQGTFHEDDRGVSSIDPLSFQARQSYRTRIIDAQRRSGLTESALTGTGRLGGREIVIAALDIAFLGGSIGVASGERIARAFEKATSRNAPIVTVCSTSGTRMQEGLLALMQLPRIAVAVNRHAAAGLPHIAILTDPATGSAYTGFANQADIIIAEPNALVGFAALRALQETEGRELPASAHTSESHLEHGLVDMIVPRPELRDRLASLIDMLIHDLHVQAEKGPKKQPATHSTVPAWDQVQLSRHRERPTASDFVELMTGSFFELRGDRSGTDDKGIIAGIATIGGEAAMIIGQERPASGSERDGWVRAAGFGKAIRAMRLASKFGLPVVTLIDTRGADPSLDEEEAGLGNRLTACLSTMLNVPTPTIAVITGEGSSEAAVAMAAADRVLMLDNAVYEVVRPEDAAAILYGESSRANEAAERLRVTSHDALKLGLVDATIPEPGDGAHTDPVETARVLQRAIVRNLVSLQRERPKRRMENRYARYREVGSTHSKLRGRLDRRFAHLADRIGTLRDRLRRRNRVRATDFTDIPF